MDNNRKKELIAAYKNRKPEMGVVACRDLDADTTYLDLAKDTGAALNGIRARLKTNTHPNKELQQRWNERGPEGFAFSVARVLKYDDPTTDHKEELRELREECLAADPKAKKMWR